MHIILIRTNNVTQVKGLWTWTRGGGWWGPYIHGNELWVDLHAHVLATWWLANTNASATSHVTSPMTEQAAFTIACATLIPGCSGTTCCNALRNITQSGALAVLYGQYGDTLRTCPGDWMRDDRIGGLAQTQGHFASLQTDVCTSYVCMCECAYVRAVLHHLSRVRHATPPSRRTGR